MKNLTLLTLMLIIGCSSPTMSRKDFLKTTSRIYEKTSKEEILSNVEKVLKLADNDFTFVHTEDGFIATRKFTIFLLIAASVGRDEWIIKVKEIEKDKFRISTLVSTSGSNVGGYASSGDTGVVTSPTTKDYIQGNALYNLFYGRLDYFQKSSKTWITCDQFNKIMKTKKLWGKIEPLCQAFTIDDNSPEIVKK